MSTSITKVVGKSRSVAFNKPRLFIPALTRQIVDNTGGVIEEVGGNLSDTNIGSTSSFRYDPPGAGLRSTQQLPVDFSKFENHTFFNSAEVNVNVTFDKIINSFPFDGTKTEIEDFLDSLSGFEKYVFDSFPRTRGYLNFSGSYIVVSDHAGSSYPTLSKLTTGENVLDPGESSFTLGFHILVPSESNDCSIICQKRSDSTHGFMLALSQSSSPASCSVFFSAVSGSSFLTASMPVSKGEFVHVSALFDRAQGVNQLSLLKDGVLQNQSDRSVEMEDLSVTTSSFTIGSGSTMQMGTFSFVPVSTLSGALDEFRFYHKQLDADSIISTLTSNVFSEEDLKLYFKFNEPSGSLGSDSAIVLDSSGKSLHSRITNFSYSLRSTSSFVSPMVDEDLSLNPILFPGFSDVVTLNVELLASASAYDQVNPNLITKLIPPHYLKEGQLFEGFSEEEGPIIDQYEGGAGPKTGMLGDAQVLSAMLYVWAKFFDELKMMIDQLSNVLYSNYDDDDTVADQFLPFLFNYYGFDVPNFFSNATIDQFINGTDLTSDGGLSQVTLKDVQNQIWRRILTNIQEIIRSKGTVHSVKVFLRSAGINPDTSLRIREYGGPTKRSLDGERVSKSEISTLLLFTGSLSDVSSSLNAQGFPTNKPWMISGYLSGSRVEAGFPSIQGTFVNKPTFSPHGISNNPEDGLFTSGSWSVEGIYKFPYLSTGSYAVSQSLLRMCVTGTAVPSNVVGTWANVILVSGSDESTVKLIVRNSTAVSASVFELAVSGVNLFDGNTWSVSAGRFRSDDPSLSNAVTFPSSSWFLRCARQSFGAIVESATTQSYGLTANANNDVSQNKLALNTSGSFIIVGSQSIGTAGGLFLNDASVSSVGRVTDFGGRVGHIRFWSKGLVEDEWAEHTQNFKSVGVLDPFTNFNFSLTPTGAFSRVRLDASTDQPVTQSDSLGRIQIFDFSQNNLHFSGSGFEPSIEVIKPETFYYSHLTTRFDEAATDNKVRVRGYTSEEKAADAGVGISPVTSLVGSETPEDDTRFTVDFSVVDALDEDISNIFATFSYIDQALGEMSLLHTSDYPGLDRLRNVYFERLTGRVNLRLFFEFFKWFDASLGMFIEQLLPRKTNFQGVNYVIESHMLERAKVSYLTYGVYLTDDLRENSTVISDSEGIVGNSAASETSITST